MPSGSIERLTETIQTLARERQDLRSRGASAEALERNRLELVRRQWELSHALIQRYLPGAADALPTAA